MAAMAASLGVLVPLVVLVQLVLQAPGVLPALHRIRWLGSLLASATTTGDTETALSVAAAAAAAGRETSFPGVPQRRYSRSSGLYLGPDIQQAFSCGHRRQFQYFSAPLIFAAVGAPPCWPVRVRHLLLG